MKPYMSYSLQLHFSHVFIPFSNVFNFMRFAIFIKFLEVKGFHIYFTRLYMSMKRGKWAGFMQTVVSFAPVSRKGICKHQPIDWSLRDGNRGSDVYRSLVYVKEAKPILQSGIYISLTIFRKAHIPSLGSHMFFCF